MTLLTLFLMMNLAQTGDIRLTIVDPGHFHAALIQRDMYPGISPKVSVYAPLGPEVLDYLNRVSLFNSRPTDPTDWQLDVHTGPDFFTRMLAEHSGNAVLFTGRNRPKINRILQALDAGYHVFADKPWIIRSSDLDELTLALDRAREKKLAAYDIMTERFEITSILQREFVNTAGVFGKQLEGTPTEPGIKASSIHHLMKVVAGVPLKRPVWFFNIDEYGEALADVGTHVVDLVQWTAFPQTQLDYQRDVQILSGRRWPTLISRPQFEQVTGAKDFPAEVMPWVKEAQLNYFANNAVSYQIRGVHIGLDILWNWEAAPGTGDVYAASFRGSMARVEIRQGKEERYIPELYVVPAAATPAWRKALAEKMASLEKTYPGLSWDAAAGRVSIPERYRVGHEAHFAQVARRFFDYVRNPASMDAWERSNMLVKYYITTRGVEISRPE
jgi:predicted dehydrogenase